MNFGKQEVRFDFKFTECIFKLSEKDDAKENVIRLDGFGGMVLKT
jgi:hypothetical protein